MASHVTPLSALAVAVIGITLYLLVKPKLSKNDVDSQFLNSLPVVGVRRELFAWARASLRSYYDTKDWIFYGYFKYSKANQPFVIPSLDRGPMVVVPPRQIKKLYDLPEDVLDIHTTQNVTIQTRWTIKDQEVADNDFQINVVRHQITRNLGTLTPVIARELKLGFERWWGTETQEWKEVKIWDSCLKLVAGASNGAFCGTPLCRDGEFLEMLRDHGITVFAGALFINSTPKPLRPIAGKLVSMSCNYYFKKALKLSLPIVKERLDNTANLKANPHCDWTPPKDGLQWLIDECYASGDAAQLDPERVCFRLLFVNDISLHSTAYTAHNVILDVWTTDPSSGVVEALREECETVFKQFGGVWTREAITKLKLLDSAIRESMRLAPFASVGLPRRVIHPDGVMLKSPELHLPQGSMLAIPIEAIHQDNDIYPEARRFDAFRFARSSGVTDILSSATFADSAEKAEKADAEPNNHRSTVTLDNAFLGFGFGKHACPGRFFALNELKIFMAHLLLNYDVQYMKSRPPLTNRIWLKYPQDVPVRVRRRVGT
ncbi:ent-kaurene oxidase [Hypoxylon cercidicola]|nr:ent-kaurene oxidase [Hypoxylon cercidicola]